VLTDSCGERRITPGKDRENPGERTSQSDGHHDVRNRPVFGACHVARLAGLDNATARLIFIQ
jgi:hypothetical protein